jgi:hypothetical protein
MAGSGVAHEAKDIIFKLVDSVPGAESPEMASLASGLDTRFGSPVVVTPVYLRPATTWATGGTGASGRGRRPGR